AQRCVDLRENLLAREAAATVGRLPVELRGEDVRLAWTVGEHLAEELLRPSARVHIRGVDEVDSELERLRHARLGAVPLDASAVRQPGAERDLGPHQVARAEPPPTHGCDANG